MVAITMVNGLMTKKMVVDNTNTKMRPDIMGNGKKISEKDMELIIILMEIDMRGIGILIYKMEWVLIIITTMISIKVNGLMENLMAKVIIFIMGTKVYIKVIGKMVRRKDLVN
jgi:hypothetical protein